MADNENSAAETYSPVGAVHVLQYSVHSDSIRLTPKLSFSVVLRSGHSEEVYP